MPYNETPAQVRKSLDRARADGLDRICREAERKVGITPGLLLAIASRETHCRNVVGDGGHGRGYFQIDDRSHQAFLRRHGALGAGGIPPVREAALYAAQIVADNLRSARKGGVRDRDVLHVALAGYNAGPGNALNCYREGDCDSKTAHGNYGRDVLNRLEIVLDWLDAKPTKPEQPLLREGSRGPAVLELKRKLAAWYTTDPPFAMTPVFGPGTTAAVRAFQEAHRLEIDGEVGPNTWKALGRIKLKTPA
jgi:hypothetical protein